MSISPVSDAYELYLPRDWSLDMIIDHAREHFQRHYPDEEFDMANYSLRAEHFHARCIGYDLYDPSDYDDYAIIYRSI